MMRFPKWFISLNGKDITIDDSGRVFVDGSVTDLIVLNSWSIIQVLDFLWSNFGPTPKVENI